MRISARCDYACKALLELALHWPSKEPMQIQVLSQNQGIPIKYLVQILIQLKMMGIVESVRGKEGGYNLSKPPKEITLSEIIRGTGESFLSMANSVEKDGGVFISIWHEVENVIGDVLNRVTFEDIINKARGAKKTVMYHI